ncbi:fatty acid desaturase family protein [Salinisphaera orenii]|uniref:Fatty acid desaturase n=1 Tax=Salinisphaera orenii YIM 95161 TaxID=1051139 RepID=A0A423PI21_9GAMM|nr:acyl-CoA desaturase [Salinisphaera halophila]ROO25247.1 fatty acid desaturase [Salinisphaera halophila YIM 95161]
MSELDNHLNSFTQEQFDQIGADFDAIRRRVINDLGERDANYIRTIVKRQRQFEVGGRAMMMLPPTWPLGVASLSLSKILDNMEIGHNVMHGQYDWMGDPALNSKNFDWDTADTAENWKATHNFEHHTYTNVVDRDHDIGYGLLRMADDQPWEPRFLLNLPLTALLHVFFQHFVAVQNLKLENYLIYKTKSREQLAEEFKPVWAKMRKQLAKDYVYFPLLAGPFAPLVFAGNMTANLTRNIWACSVIFNGHFPEEVEQFDESVLEDESRGQWYVRQLLGSANFEGSKLMHLMSGNLSYQIEHHLFPDIPACRYAEIAPEVRAICEKNGLPYHSGPFWKQALSTWKRIARLSLPDRLLPTKKPKSKAAPKAKPAAEKETLPLAA